MNDDFKKQPPPDDDDSLDWLNELPDDEQSEKRSLGFTGELSWKKDIESAFDDAAASDEDDFSWMQNQGDDAGAAQPGGSFGFTNQLDWKKAVEQGAPMGEDDSLDWLSAVEGDSSSTLPSQSTEARPPVLPQTADNDPLAWLRQHPDIEKLDTTPEPPLLDADESSIPEAGDDDPLAWLTQYEPKSDEMPAQPAAALPVDDHDALLPDPPDDDEDSLEWLLEYAPKDDDAPPAAVPATDDLPPLPGDDADPLAWLTQYERQSDVSPAPPVAAAALPDEAEEDSLEWLTRVAPDDDLPAEPAAEVDADELPAMDSAFDWMDQDAAPPAAAAVMPDTSDEEGDQLAWLRQYAPPEELVKVDQAALDDEWAQDDDEIFDVPMATPHGEQPAEQPRSWFSDDDADELPEADAMPDWLAQMNVGADAPANDDADEQPEADAMPDWLAQMNVVSNPNQDDDLLAGLDEALGLPTQPQSEMPDWLQAVAPQPAAAAEGDIFAQLGLESHDTGYDFIDNVEEPADDDIPGGLQLGEAQPTDWFAEPEADSAPADETPSWLRQLEADDEDEASAQAEADFLAELRGADKSARRGTSDFELADFSSFEARGLDDIDRLLESYEDIDPALPGDSGSMGDDALERLLSDNEMERIASARRGEASRSALPELSPDAPEWLSEIGATVGSVGEVSAAAILRKQAQQERPLEDLPERLRALHEAGKDLPQPRADAPPDVLRGVLTGIDQVIAATPIRPGLPGLVESAALNDAQRDNLKLLRGLVALDAPRAAGRSAVDITLDAPELGDLFDAEPDMEVGEKPAARRAVPARRLRLKLDRLLVALLITAAVVLPFFVGALRIGDLPVREFAAGSRGALAYQQVEALNAGDLVLVAADYGPTGAAELDDGLDALLRHILLRAGRPVLVSANPVGLLRARNRLETLTTDALFVQQLGRENRPLMANDDYYVLRYLVGDAVGLRLLGGDIAGLAASDSSGQPTNLQVTTLNDFRLIVVIAERAEDVRTWAEQIAPLTANPLLLVTGFSAAPLAEPYALSGGLLVGYRDAYTYRAMLDGGDEAVQVTPPPITTAAPPESTPEATAEMLEPSSTPLPIMGLPAETTAEAPTAAAEVTTLPPTDVPPTEVPPTEVPPSATPVPPTATPVPPSATPTVEPSATPLPTATRRPTITATPSASPTAGTGVRGVVNSNQGINVRGGAGRSFRVVAVLGPGDIVEIIGRNADESWYEVRLEDGTEGWVSAQFLLLELPGDATPTAESALRADPNAVVALDGDFSFGVRLQEATAEATPEATVSAPETSAPVPTEAAPVQRARPAQPDNRDARWYSMTLGLIVIIAVIALGAIVNILRGLFRRGAKA
jgi:uncharacterized protein YgiM (DUF1202 family)